MQVQARLGALALTLGSLAGCTRLNPAFLDSAVADGSGTGDATGATMTTSADGSESSTMSGDGDGDSGDGDSGDGDGSAGDGDGDGTTTGDGDGDGTFPFECDLGDDTLAGCWPFDGNGKDSTAYQHDLSISGVTYWSGVSGQSVLFSDLSLADTPTSVELSPTSSMTIDAWVRPGSNESYTLVSKGSAYVMNVEGGNLQCSFGNAGSVWAPAPFVAETWHHVVCMHTGTLLQVFIDGDELAAVVAQGTISAASAALHVGSLSPSWSEWYDGKIDNLRIWRRPLSHGEICAAAGASGTAQCP